MINEPNGNSLDAVESGITQCENDRPDGSVGPGNHPDENGEVTQDAMIMDGPSHDVGAVVCLRNISNPIKVARKVLDNTKHSLLAGELATQFAVQMGFNRESLVSNDSINSFNEWKNNNCQPNFWKSSKNQLTPDPAASCGPYHESGHALGKMREMGNNLQSDCSNNHDTIGMIGIDKHGDIVVGTSTNGATHKIPG